MLAVIVSLAAFLPLAVRARRNDVFAWDESISKAIHDYENRETLWNRHFDLFDVLLHPAVQLLGFLIVGGVFLLLAVRGRFRAAVFVALGVGGAAVLGIVLKEIFAQPPVDPGGSGFSFPSGHALRSMAAATVLTVVLWPTRGRWPTVVLGGVAIPLIGIAVVYHEWHWASDVLAGWLLAVAWIGCLWLALRRPQGAGATARPAPRSGGARATRPS